MAAITAPDERLTPLDSTFLELEQADPSAHMHIGALLTFDPLPRGGGTPAIDALRAYVGERLGVLPRYHRRLSQPTVGGLRRPVWEWVDRLDLDVHVTRAALPRPGGEAELLEWAGEFYSQRLDRKRPLWQLVLVEGLEDGRWALATKTHHCLVDGVGAVDVGTILLDETRRPRRGAPAAPPRRPQAGGDGHGPLRQALELGAGLALHPRRLGKVLDDARGMVEVLVRDELISSPATSLNVPMGEHRRLAVVWVALDELRAIEHALGGTVNDGVLTLVTAGLRRLLLQRGETPPGRGVRAMVPVNVRTDAERLALGNRITSLFVELPVAEADPLRRNAAVHAGTHALKSGRAGAGGKAIIDVAGLAPPVLHIHLAQSLFATRLFNVTVTNVPASPRPLYLHGARLRSVVPLVPLAAKHTVGVAALSYDGEICLCVHADRDTVPDIDEITDGMREELAALRAAAAGAVPA
jgi:WS/DGAT/MGAT family acyltransferase